MKPKNELSYQANELRKRFGEDLSSPIDVFAILQSQERLTLVFYPLSERISGMCVRTHSGDQLVAIKSKLTNGRQRFTAAHELYHLFIQKEIKSVVCGKEIGAGKDEEEKNADGFASYFLATNDALRSYIENNLKKGKNRPVSLEDVVRIEQYFRMSRQATLYRLVGDGFITLEFANTLKGKIIASARKFGFNEELYIPTPAARQYYTTGSYIELAEQLKDRELISNGKYEELLLDAYRADIVYNFEAESQETYD
ncbi:MAG: ImmA/IrrE family metallo-endopeptidase [Chloroflexi bacterium]|nr:ImmA/IrrE family metallo-endopeptidase [Chloroflexota bacterium]